MKHAPILTHVIALCLPIAAIAQERVTIDGILSDGTPPPPPPPKVLHQFKILSTEEIPLEQRKMIIHRVEDPGFPDPTPPTSAVINPDTVAALKSSPAYLEWQEKQTRTTSLFLSASVVDHRATLLRWWEGGKEFEAWSNVDFKYLTGFASNVEQVVVPAPVAGTYTVRISHKGSLRSAAAILPGHPQYNANLQAIAGVCLDSRGLHDGQFYSWSGIKKNSNKTNHKIERVGAGDAWEAA